MNWIRIAVLIAAVSGVMTSAEPALGQNFYWGLDGDTIHIHPAGASSRSLNCLKVTKSCVLLLTDCTCPGVEWRKPRRSHAAAGSGVEAMGGDAGCSAGPQDVVPDSRTVRRQRLFLISER